MADDPIAKALDLTPLAPEDKPKRNEVTINVENTDNTQVENDFEYARRNMYEIIEQGSEAVVKLMDIADQSQNPRAYEVVANLIKTMAETNKDLLALTKQKRELLDKEPPKPTENVTNNLFVGSTHELQQMLQKKKAEGQ